MSLVELGFRALVTSGSHDTDKSLQAPRGVGLPRKTPQQGHRVGMRGHGEGEESLAKKPSDNVGEVVNWVEDWGRGQVWSLGWEH